MVYNILLRMCRNQEDAMDMTQEVFVKVYKNLAKFREGSKYKTWIYRITVNMAVDFLRKKKVRRKLHDEIFDGADRSKPQLDDAANVTKRQSLLLNLIQSLKEKERLCLTLRYTHDMSYQNIADTLNMNINTVRTYIRRARQNLFNLYKEAVHREP